MPDRVVRVVVEVENKNGNKVVGDIQNSFNSLTYNINNANKATGSFFGNFASSAANKAINFVETLAEKTLEVGVASVKLAGDFQATANGLAVFTGSINSAKRELSDIDRVASNATGLRLADAEEGYQRLRALGFAADSAQKLVKGIANQKLLSNADEAAVDRVIVNITQIKASSKDANRDLKEMIKAIPSLSGVFRDIFGTSSTSELRKLLQENPKEFFEKFTSGLANAKQAQGGLNNSIEKFYDSLIQTGRTAGEPVLEPLTADIQKLTALVNENRDSWASWGLGVAGAARAAGAAIDKLSVQKNDSTPDAEKFARNTVLSIGVPFFGLLNGLAAYEKEQRQIENKIKSRTASGLSFDNVNRTNLKSFLGANNTLQFETPAEKEARLNQESVEQQEQNQKELLERFRSTKLQQLAISESFYKTEDSRLKAHLDYTTAEELKTFQSVSANRKSSIESQIIITKAYYADLIKFGNLDKTETIKAEREKNVELAKLNGELKVNEFDTQREIQQFENKIRDERRRAAIQGKSLEISSTQFGFDKQSFDVQRLIDNQIVSASDGFAKLRDLTQKHYAETSRLTLENYQIQLQDLSLTKEQRFNLTTEMFQSEQKLAEDNRRRLLDIEERLFAERKRQYQDYLAFLESRSDFAVDKYSLIGGFLDNGFNSKSLKNIQNIFDIQGESGTSSLDKNFLSLIKGLDGSSAAVQRFEEAQRALVERSNYFSLEKARNEVKDFEAALSNLQLKADSNFREKRADLLNRIDAAGNQRDKASANADGLPDVAVQSNIQFWTDKISDLKKELAELDKIGATIDPIAKQNVQDSLNLAKSKLSLATLKNQVELTKLWREQTGGLKEDFEALANLQPEAMTALRQAAEKDLWAEKKSILQENRLLEFEYYKDADLLALQRRNKLLQYERDIFEIRQELNEKSTFNAIEAQARMLEVINRNTKSQTDIWVDAFESAFEKTGSLIDKYLDKSGIGKIPIIGDIAKAQGRNALGGFTQDILGKFFPDLAKDLDKTGNPQLDEARKQTKIQEQTEKNTRALAGGAARPRTVQDVIKTVTGGGNSGGLFSGQSSSNPNIFSLNQRGGRFGDGIDVEGILSNGRGEGAGGGILDRLKGGFGSMFGAKKNLLTGDMSKGAGIVGGVGSLLGLAGGAIGGKWGNALSYAGTGAQFGANFGLVGSLVGLAAGGTFGILKALFGGDKTIKKLKDASKSQFQIAIDDATAKQVKLIGEQFFGKGNAAKDPNATVQLEPAKDLILSYGKKSGQSVLGIEKAFYGDESWSGNQFGAKFGGFKERGGRVAAGYSYVIGEKRPELFIPDRSGTILPSVPNMADNSRQSQLQLAQSERIETLLEILIERFQTVSAGELVAIGLNQNPSAAANAVESTYQNDYKRSENLFRNTGQG